MRVRKTHHPAAAAMTSAASVGTNHHPRFGMARVETELVTCAGAAAAADDGTMALGGFASSTDGSAVGTEPDGAGGGMDPTAAVLPDSVSRFSRRRSVRMSEACW